MDLSRQLPGVKSTCVSVHVRARAHAHTHTRINADNLEDLNRENKRTKSELLNKSEDELTNKL